MPFLIETFDKPDHGHVRARERDVHLAFLEHHKRLLLACGAKLNDDGSSAGGGIYIVDVETREEAEAFIAQDPFSLVDLFERVSIVRWRKAYVDGACYL
jgi:uncharacterized protein